MSYTDEIYACCAGMASEPSGEKKAAMLAMCLSAETELTERLRPEVSPQSLGELFINACAVLALSMYIELQGAFDGLTSVRLGDLSVSLRGASSVRTAASALRRQAETMLSAYLEDSGFCFMGVRG